MFELKIKSVLKYGLIFLLFPVIVNFTLFSAKLPWVFGTEDNWLSFWGNYTGGIISAFVAYFVANSQVRKQLELDITKDNRARLINELPALIRLKVELVDIIRHLSYVSREIEFYSSRFSYDTSSDPYQFQTINEENWMYLDQLTDVDLQVELIYCKKFYKDFSNSLKYNYKATRKRIEELEQKSSPSPSPSFSLSVTGEDKLNGLNATDHAELVNLQKEYELMDSIKDRSLKALESNYYLEELEKHLDIINSYIEEIKKLQHAKFK